MHHFTIRARQYRLDLGPKTRIMGILNLTPDSFSRDGCLKNGNDPRRNCAMALKLVAEGADIIDIGGESTRPGAQAISPREEMARILPTIKLLKRQTKIPISVDTYKPAVAKASLEAGASIINNIMGSRPDHTLLKIIKDYQAAVVLMHIRGTPRTMQKNIRYKNLIAEIIEELKKSLEFCLEMGIKSDRIMLDPGLGFGKTVAHNLEIIRRLKEFEVLKQPLLLGPSRKSFIGKILRRDIGERLSGTIAAVCAGILNGAHIIRVHDAAQIHDAVRIIDRIRGNHH